MKKHKKTIIFIGIIIVVIGVSAGVAIFLSNMRNKADTSDDVTGISRLPSEEKADAADKVALENDVATGVKEFDKAIEGTSDSHEKFVLYSRKATLLFNNSDFDGALTAATAAYNLEKTSDSAAFVGQIAHTKGDKVVALEYYKKAKELIDATDPFAKQDGDYYDSIIAELETGKVSE